MTLAATTIIDKPQQHYYCTRGYAGIASVVRNTGNGATLHSQKNLWIQKDALGNQKQSGGEPFGQLSKPIQVTWLS